MEIYVPVEISEEQLFAQGIKVGINFDNFDQSLVSNFLVLNKVQFKLHFHTI